MPMLMDARIEPDLRTMQDLINESNIQKSSAHLADWNVSKRAGPE
jgi:beta-xylosidase